MSGKGYGLRQKMVKVDSTGRDITPKPKIRSKPKQLRNLKLSFEKEDK